ncbi:MAG: hypothetical protein QXF01_01745 [Candidatus Micrarchaeaceae archaeon]
MVGKGIRRVSRGCHYFFVKPRLNGNAHMIAAKLLALEPIREVSITEGEYGFLVKADQIYESEKDIIVRISKVVKARPSMAVCHCSYIKSH